MSKASQCVMLPQCGGLLTQRPESALLGSLTCFFFYSGRDREHWCTGHSYPAGLPLPILFSSWLGLPYLSGEHLT